MLKLKKVGDKKYVVVDYGKRKLLSATIVLLILNVRASILNLLCTTRRQRVEHKNYSILSCSGCSRFFSHLWYRKESADKVAITINIVHTSCNAKQNCHKEITMQFLYYSVVELNYLRKNGHASGPTSSYPWGDMWDGISQDSVLQILYYVCGRSIEGVIKRLSS